MPETTPPRTTSSGQEASQDRAALDLLIGQSSFVDLAGVTFHQRLDGRWGPGGDSQPVIVYLHSLGADLRIFDAVVARLPERRHLRLDLRGHGLSDAPEGPYSIAQLADDVTELMSANGVNQAVLVGVSVGGLIALRAVLDNPKRVIGLVLSDTAAKIGDEAIWNARIETVEEQGLAALADGTLLRWFSEEFREANEPLIHGYGNMVARCPAAGYRATCAALRDEDLRHRLSEVQLATLVICGSEDASTPPPLVQELASSLPRARFELIDGAGHLPMADSPEAFTAVLTDYLNEVERV